MADLVRYSVFYVVLLFKVPAFKFHLVHCRKDLPQFPAFLGKVPAFWVVPSPIFEVFGEGAPLLLWTFPFFDENGEGRGLLPGGFEVLKGGFELVDV